MLYENGDGYHNQSMEEEFKIRMAAFRWLKDNERSDKNVFHGQELAEGFNYSGRRITLKGQTGIWFPKGFQMPISITTRKNGPYPTDGISEDGVLTYAYRGTDPNHHDNIGLRNACKTRTPLIYFNEVHDSIYEAAWPIIIIQDDPGTLCVKAMMEPAYQDLRTASILDDNSLSPLDIRRYVTIATKHRLHQTAFRELVLHAYDEKCAICKLHHAQLLDAAHIIPDSTVEGFPIVSNGLSLCKIHHAAFDNNFIGIDQNYTVHVKPEILKENDGPMLRHGLQALNGWALNLPEKRRDRPDRDRLLSRFKQYLEA